MRGKSLTGTQLLMNCKSLQMYPQFSVVANNLLLHQIMLNVLPKTLIFFFFLIQSMFIYINQKVIKLFHCKIKLKVLV